MGVAYATPPMERGKQARESQPGELMEAAHSTVAVIMRVGDSNGRAKPKPLVLLTSRLGFATFLRTAATFLSDVLAVSVVQ